MSKRLNKVISVAMTEEQYQALVREANEKGCRIPDLVRWMASDLVYIHKTMDAQYNEQVTRLLEQIPEEEYGRIVEGSWESPPDGEAEKSLRRLNAEDWATWMQRRMGE